MRDAHDARNVICKFEIILITIIGLAALTGNARILSALWYTNASDYSSGSNKAAVKACGIGLSVIVICGTTCNKAAALPLLYLKKLG